MVREVAVAVEVVAVNPVVVVLLAGEARCSGGGRVEGEVEAKAAAVAAAATAL